MKFTLRSLGLHHLMWLYLVNLDEQETFVPNFGMVPCLQERREGWNSLIGKIPGQVVLPTSRMSVVGVAWLPASLSPGSRSPRMPVGSILGAGQVHSARPFSTWPHLAKSRGLIHQSDTSRSHASRYEIVVSVFVLEMHKPCRKHQPAMMQSYLDS